MGARREMARGLGPVLLVIVVIGALVGVFEGEGFAEGDTVKEEESGVEAVEEGWWMGVERVVDLGLKVVLGVWGGIMSWAMLRVMREQRKAERRRDGEVWREGKYRVVDRLLEVIGEVWSGRKLDSMVKMRVMMAILRAGEYGGQVREWMKGVPEKVDELERVWAGLRTEGLREEEVKRFEERRDRVIDWLAKGIVRVLGSE